MNEPRQIMETVGQEGATIRVRGLVQGVGFRPTVWRLARECGLGGEVLNDSKGVLIRASGQPAALRRFLERLSAEAPPLARIDGIDCTPSEDIFSTDGAFVVTESRGGDVRTGVVPDAATCPACLSEIMDPANRRHRYPFTNCTHCGPRLSIIKSIPYDREATSMSVFDMCPACRSEYENPGDRRFHAQPNACADCGPTAWLKDADGAAMIPDAHKDAIDLAQSLILDGAIVAVKGIGGFHLACNATDDAAVTRLRQRKRRYHKPFALMARDVSVIGQYAKIDDQQASLLADTAAPVVVLDRIEDGAALAQDIAPGQSSLGFMLPYTPLHHLLFDGLDHPIVMTSGNRSDEPQCTDNDEARVRLQGIADYWLLHDREIVTRLDDSVIRSSGNSSTAIRRARGYAPTPMTLPKGFENTPAVLAMGGELKNTFCLLRNGEAVLSPHIGDLEHPAAHADYRANLALYRNLYEFSPDVIAIDRHRDYLSTQWGKALADDCGAAIVDVQHHHAHVASCLVEHRMPLDHGPVLGIVLDGLGFGDDGTLWGGEFLKADYANSERLAHFAAVPLLGGGRAMREPWRNTYAHLKACMDWQSLVDRRDTTDIIRFLSEKPLATLDTMARNGVNAPPASSAGRLFDAVAAALGLCREEATYEGQAAIELEALATAQGPVTSGYGFDLSDDPVPVIGWAPLWRHLLDDLAAGESAGLIAMRFHRGLIDTIVTVAEDQARKSALRSVVLSGGVFQNQLLRHGVTTDLQDRGLNVLTQNLVPANDGGLALGQAAIAAAYCQRLNTDDLGEA